MSEAYRGIKVARKSGEQFRKMLVDLGAFDRRRKMRSDESHVYLPILEIDDSTRDKLGQVGEFEWVETEFPQEDHHPSPEEILGYRPSFETVGDIAIIEDKDPEKVACALMSTCKSIKTVVAPISDVEGEFRTRRFKVVAGEVRTTTTHKEHGLSYRVDLGGTYFTPRLGTERLRIAGLVSPSDTVLDMFAGVGPFALLLAKMGSRVVAMDKNPVAVRYLRENARLNKVENIEILEGDAAELALSYKDWADHIIMNLPHSASQFLIPAMTAAKSGGIIHYYAISPEEDLYRDVALIEKAAQQMGVSVEVLYRGVVRSYSPRRYNVVIDFRVRKPLK
jgi:tRNA (guanine37-N1)-methyltransferase